MIHLNGRRNLKDSFKKEYIMDFLLAAAAIILFTAMVYYSVSTLAIS